MHETTRQSDRQDHRVRDLLRLRLTLRDDLRFTPHFEAGESCYLVEDLARTQFFHIGVAEYHLISMFDGATSVGDALVQLAALDGDYALTESEATAICKWLIDSELAFTPESCSASRLDKQAKDRATRKRLAAWNPLCMKVPLAYPDQLFSRISPWLSPLFGPLAAILGFVLLALAAYRISASWDAFAVASAGVFSPGRWIWLAACWLVLKIVHESAHGIVCRKYGGSVHEAGVIFILFAPLAYVDLTSSWRFRSKWQRIHTAVAGMQVELLIAAAAALVWSSTAPGRINDLCFNLMIMASLTTLVFNANPLMRFDGYYILSDLLEIPNLYSQGQHFLQYLGRRYVLGEKIPAALSWRWRGLFTRVYGVAAFVWRILICASLVLAATYLFHGLGLILAAIAVMLWVAVPLYRLFRYVLHRDGLQRRRQTRLALAAGVAGGLLLLILQLGWPGASRAPAIVSYEPINFVRASSPGFVREIHVSDGQNVQAGDLIAVLENHQLVAELQDLEFAIEQTRLKLRVFRQQEEMHSYHAELDQLKALEQKRDEKREQVNLLELRAPASGRVISRDLPLMLHTYLATGDGIAVIGDESRKELQIAIEQSDFDRFRSQLGRRVNVRITGGVRFANTLTKVNPRATTRAPDESMYAAHGGSLESRAVDGDSGSDDFQILSPHFVGVIPLTAAQSRDLRAGQRGTIWFGRGQQSIAAHLKRKLVSFACNLTWVDNATPL